MNHPSHTNSGGTSLSQGGFQATRWLLPALALLALIVLGLWTYDAVEQSVKKKLEVELGTILKADVKALSIWLDQQRTITRVLASDAEFRDETSKLLAFSRKPDANPRRVSAHPSQRYLQLCLEPACKNFNYTGFRLVTPSGLVLSASEESLVGRPSSAQHLQLIADPQLTAKNADDRTFVTRPFLDHVPSLRDDGRSLIEAPTMYVLSPVDDRQGEMIAVLLMRIAPEDDFTRILQVAQIGESGATYAFDDKGVLLSESRFNDDLKEIGLLKNERDARSSLHVQIRDPGGNMLRGHRTNAPRSSQPLTYMAASAVEAKQNDDRRIWSHVDGYNDFRGVPVIGAWQWLHDYDFGVATEVEVAQAYAPLVRLRTTVWALFCLVTVATGAVLIYSRSVTSLRRRMHRAEKKIEQLGQYTLETKIGEGGMGEVYRARHAMLRRPTAVKLLRPERGGTDAVARFEREVQLTSQLTHPNTIAIYDYGRTPDDVFYYAMEYLDGVTLNRMIVQGGPLPEGRVIHFLIQVCGSLEEAHSLGLIHRDIKPANVMVCRRGGLADVVKVLDFGLVKDIETKNQHEITMANVITGTPLYLSPEAIGSPDLVDARSDLYSVGAMGYYLLTGKNVFEGNSTVEICFQHLKQRPRPMAERVNTAISPDVEALIMSCLNKDPTTRPQSAREMADALEECTESASWTQVKARTWWNRFHEVARPRHIRQNDTPAAGPNDPTIDMNAARSRR